MSNPMQRHSECGPMAQQIDDLIDYYEKFGRPGAGLRIPVYATPRQLAQAIGQPLPLKVPEGYKEPREFNYRGRVLIASRGAS